MRRYLCSIFSIFALSACGGTSAPPTASSVASDRFATSVARAPSLSHADRRKSWLSPELARIKAPVLFVSDSGTADVYIYNISTLKLIGTITGFSQPQGECSDSAGNVWITDANAQIVYELSHHGYLENEITDSAGYPAACAWNQSARTLAVMNLFSTGSAPGAVYVYAAGSGSPKVYGNPAQYYYDFGGYDTAGNLFFDGRDATGKFILSELPKGGQQAQTIKLSGGTIYFPGMVQWDAANSDLIVGDQSCGNIYVSCIYIVKISGKSGTITRKIKLKNYAGGQPCDLIQGVEYNNQLFGSDYDFCGYATTATYVWPYPGGGAPTHYNKTTVVTPVGATISR